jgi:hypothetical protein
MEGNNLRLMVGNEFFDYKANNIDIDIEIDIPNLIDYGFNIPNIPDNVRTGYIYFNLEIQQLAFDMWRGVPYISFPDRNMIFPSGYRMNNGKIYWGTDIQIGLATSLVQRSIKLTGSTERDILAEFGIYDQQFIDFLRNFVYEAYNLMKNYADWYNHTLDNPNTYRVATAVDNARKIFNALYTAGGIEGVINVGKKRLGEIANDINTEDLSYALFYIGLNNLVDEIAGVIAGALGGGEGLALILGFLLYSGAESIMDGVYKWNEWKQTHGDNFKSFAEFLVNYFNPTPSDPINADNFWSNWAEHIIDSCSLITKWLDKHLGINKNNYDWENFLNSISNLAPQVITNDLKPYLDRIFEYTLVNCNYGFAKYDGWFFPKYHIYKVYNLQTPNYELCGMIPLPDGDVFLKEIELTKNNIDSLFNKPNYPLLLLKTWKNSYTLLSKVIEEHEDVNLVIGSTLPSYLQMKAFGIPKIRIE